MRKKKKKMCPGVERFFEGREIFFEGLIFSRLLQKNYFSSLTMKAFLAALLLCSLAIAYASEPVVMLESEVERRSSLKPARILKAKKGYSPVIPPLPQLAVPMAELLNKANAAAAAPNEKPDELDAALAAVKVGCDFLVCCSVEKKLHELYLFFFVCLFLALPSLYS